MNLNLWRNQFFRIWNSGANSLLLPANPVNTHWSTNAISDWSMSNLWPPPPSQEVQDPRAGKRLQGRKIRKITERDQAGRTQKIREEKRSAIVSYLLSWLPCSMAACATWEGFLLKGRATLAWRGFFYELGFGICPHCAHSFSPCRRKHIFQNQVLDLSGCKPLKIS